MSDDPLDLRLQRALETRRDLLEEHRALQVKCQALQAKLHILMRENAALNQKSFSRRLQHDQDRAREARPSTQ